MGKKHYYIRDSIIVSLNKILKAARQQIKWKQAIVNNKPI